MSINYLEALRNDLQSLNVRSELYKLLKQELSILGYWKNKQRGNARAGYKASPLAQQTATLRQQLKHSTIKQANDYD